MEMQPGDNQPDRYQANRVERLLDLFGLYRSKGQLSEAEALLTQLLRCANQFSDNEAIVLTCLTYLAELYWDQRRYNEAETTYHRLLQVIEHLLGADHLDSIGTLYSLAELYIIQQRYAEAEKLHIRIIRILQQHSGADAPVMAVRFNDLAVVYALWQDYPNSVSFFKRAIALLKQHYGINHLHTKIVQRNLLQLHRRRYHSRINFSILINILTLLLPFLLVYWFLQFLAWIILQ